MRGPRENLRRTLQRYGEGIAKEGKISALLFVLTARLFRSKGTYETKFNA